MNNNLLLSNFKKTDICYTKYGNSMYSELWYCDNKNKICITFSPRAGCSIAFQQFLDLVGLLNDGLKYNNYGHIHAYRIDFMHKYIKNVNINDLINKQYTFIKFIINPYIRAISIYRCFDSHNLSFREHLKQIINNKINYYSDNDKYHSQSQYIEGEENIITKYIKIDKNEIYQIKLNDNSLFTLDVNKYTSCHHGTKTNNTSFCGDEPKDIINNKLPKTYKYFYDDEIRKMVETIYEKDIKNYGYDFDDFDY